MAIKDIIGPSFVGTTTIKWMPTRGFSIAGPVSTSGDTWELPTQDKNWTLANLCKNWQLPSLSKIWPVKRKR